MARALRTARKMGTARTERKKGSYKKIEWSKDRPVKPDVDPLLTKIRAKLATDKRTMWSMANESGISESTLRNMLNGKTKRPQGVSLQMAARMLGGRVEFIEE